MKKGKREHKKGCKTMKKKLLSTITILCMLCAFLPTFVSAENQMLEQGIIVKADGVYIGTSETAATPDELASYGISFTAGSPAKLTLNNTTIITETGVDASEQISSKTVNSAIYLATAANIELIGKNVAANDYTNTDRFVCAVYAPNSLTVTGSDGKLAADIKNAISSAGASVYCGGAFVNSSSIELQRASKTYGLYAKTSLENSGELKAEGSNNSTYGVYAGGALTNNGTITGEGKNYGVYSAGQMTNNGTMTAENSTTNNGAVHSGNNITNTGTMNASTGAGYAVCTSFTFYNKGSESICNADSNSSAISALAVNNEGTLIAGSAGGTKANSYGIKISSGGSVTNSGKLEARGCIGGVYISSGTFTNNAGGDVFCEAGSGKSYALYCNGKITNGGKLEVRISNGGTEAYGIYTAGTTLENKAGAEIKAHIDEYILDGTNRWAVTTKAGAIYVVNVGINNSGKITATTPNTAVTNYAVYATSTITNNAGGEIYATSGGSKGSSSICGAVHSNSSYIVNFGFINATAVSSDYITRGIYAKTQLVNSGVIEASAGAGGEKGNSMGIFVGNSASANVALQNNEGGKITASAEQYGVFVASGFLYNDGEFTATAPNTDSTFAFANNAGGLYLPNVGDKITAHGGTLFNGGYGDYYTVSGSNTEMMAKSLTCVADPIVIENKKYTVSFNTNGAGTVNPQVTSAYVTEPTGLSKKGYVLDGWYYGDGLSNKFDFSSYVRSDFVLTAKWIPDSIALTVDKDKNYTVDITTASLEGTIFVALYDGDKLLKVNEHPLSDSAKILGSFTEEGTKVKAFWWDSLENMKPKALFDVKDIPAE